MTRFVMRRLMLAVVAAGFVPIATANAADDIVVLKVHTVPAPQNLPAELLAENLLSARPAPVLDTVGGLLPPDDNGAVVHVLTVQVKSMPEKNLKVLMEALPQ